MKYSVKTFGCKVNTYDTSLIQQQMKSISFKETDSPSAQFHVVNTCAVTETAVAESLRWIRRYRRKNPKTKIVVTGCGVQTELNRYSQSQEVDLIIANSHKHKMANILKNYSAVQSERVFHSNIFKNTDKGEGGQVESHRTRLFLKIQDGCSQFCTFCIIPFARGKSRSVSAQHLIRQINKHHSEGVMEVVLTGVHIADYFDPETRTNLTDLVRSILLKTSIPRIRLSSLEPVELTDDLLSLYKDQRMCPHFHLSIQSGSSKVLREMKRKYTREDVQICLEKIQKFFPSAFVGMDIIAGFPGETQENFEDTYELFKNTFWTEMHVFPYSPRPKTYALKSQNHCSKEVIFRRASLLRNLSQQRYQVVAQAQVGKIKYFLPLKTGAISRDYWKAEWSHLDTVCSEQKSRLISWNPEKKAFKTELIL